MPWPSAALGAPLNPARDWLLAAEAGGAAYIRLAYALFYLPTDEGMDVLRLAVRAGREVLAADFKWPERNLELPACLLVRALLRSRGGVALTEYWAQGGLEGLARRAGVRVAARRPLLGGAAVLLRLHQ